MITEPRETLAAFLRARRSQIKPEDVGFPAAAGRRIPGLRRDEVAVRAGISLEYYVRLEQGRGNQISDRVLGSLANALLLDRDATEYLFRITRMIALFPVGSASSPPSPARLTEMMAQWSFTAAYVHDRNFDIVAVNDMAHALATDYARVGNSIVEMMFTMPPDLRTDQGWRETARVVVESLRFWGDPRSRRFQELVGTMTAQDADFREMWESYGARPMTTGTSPSYFDGYGWVEFPWHVIEMQGGYFMTVWGRERGTAVDEIMATTRAQIDARGGRAVYTSIDDEAADRPDSDDAMTA